MSLEAQMRATNIISFLGILLASTFVLESEAAIVDFHCGNAPAKIWGEYYAVVGDTTDFSKLNVLTFGLFEGSTADEGEEPVNTVDEFVAPADPSLKASSAGWKDAVPFDLTTIELGKAVLYLKQKDFAGASGYSIARLKFSGKDLRLDCQFTTR